MKAEKITIGGKVYYLYFNGNAKFDIDELCGGKSIADIVDPKTRKGAETLFKAVTILADQGELVRRKLGYDHGEFLTVDEIKLFYTPVDTLMLNAALLRAITRGYGTEIKDDDEEVDLVLQEIEAKSGKSMNKPSYLYMASLVGIQPSEALIMCPGEVFDEFTLWRKANQRKDESAET